MTPAGVGAAETERFGDGHGLLPLRLGILSEAFKNAKTKTL